MNKVKEKETEGRRLYLGCSPAPLFTARKQNMGNFFCCVKVEQSTVAIKERFGKYQNVLQPGSQCVPWLLGDQLAGHLSLKVQQLDVRCETKTKDGGFVNVVLSIHYRVMADKANEAFYELSNTKGQIQGHVFDVIRATVPILDLDDVLGRKNEFAGAVKEKLENAMSAYGYTIVQTLVIDVVPDERMKKAINENNAAALMRVTANEKLEAEMNLQIKRAEGEAKLQIKRAEGEAKLQLIRAEGEAKLQLIRAEGERQSGLGIAGRRQAIVDGLKESVLGFPRDVPGITAKDFNTLKQVGSSSKSSAVFIPHGLDVKPINIKEQYKLNSQQKLEEFHHESAMPHLLQHQDHAS